MESDSLLSTLSLAVSIAGFGFALVVGTCIGSIRRERVQALVAQNAGGAEQLERLGVVPGGNTAALGLVASITGVGAVISSIALTISLAGIAWPLITLVSASVMVFLWLVSSLAKGMAMAYGEKISLRAAPVALKLAQALSPIAAAHENLSRRLMMSRGQQNNGIQDVIDEIPTQPQDSNSERLDEREARMIRAVVQLDKTVAREIMIPRMDMVAVHVDTPLSEMAEQMVSGGHSRVPVFGDNLDDIRGIAHARDVLDQMVKGTISADASIESIMRPPLFIPESKTLEGLLNEFQEKRLHMAIVVDEYGGVSGLVTIEDLLEEIVGEIMDEFDVAESEVVSINDNEYLIDARASIDSLTDIFQVSVETNGFDTIGGFVYHSLGKIPSPGDSVEYDGLTIEVVSTVGRRLKRLRVRRRVPQETESV